MLLRFRKRLAKMEIQLYGDTYFWLVRPSKSFECKCLKKEYNMGTLDNGEAARYIYIYLTLSYDTYDGNTKHMGHPIIS
jgi:hypothetical protein